MGDGIVEVGAYQDEPSAWIARTRLAAGGIRSEVLADHLYALPVPRVRLVVREEDAEAARRILASGGNG